MIDTQKKRTVLVTGSRTRIGKVIAKTLAGQGYRVIIHSRSNQAEAQRVSREINVFEDPIWIAELSEKERCVASFQSEVLSQYPDTAIVLNASEFEDDAMVGKIELPMLQRMLAIHYETSIGLIQAAAQHAQSSHAQAIVLLDQNVVNLQTHFLAYCLSKSAMYDALPRLALAMAPFRINGVAPGPTLPLPNADQERFNHAALATPLKHAVDPQDIADTIKFLLTANAITGQTIFVDSGQHLCSWTDPAVYKL